MVETLSGVMVSVLVGTCVVNFQQSYRSVLDGSAVLVCVLQWVTCSAFRPMQKGITTSSTSYVPPHICQNSKPSSWVREPPHFHTGFQHNSNWNTFAHSAFFVATFSMIVAWRLHGWLPLHQPGPEPPHRRSGWRQRNVQHQESLLSVRWLLYAT